MNIKIKIVVGILMCFIGVALALESGEEIADNNYNVRTFKNIAIKVGSTGSNYLAKKYQVVIYAINTTINDHPSNVMETFKPVKQTIDRKLWTITSDQLPLTEMDCINLLVYDCDEDTRYCYKHCLTDLPPRIIAFDSQRNKAYISYGTHSIGTGGGPALLFSADINTRTMKFAGRIAWQDDASLSPSGRYLVMYGLSIISIYDAKTEKWFNIHDSENNYHSTPYIYHYLDLKKWLSDTKFIYIDNARYFTRNTDPKPFISAKEYTYDLETRTRSGEKTLSEAEYNKVMKELESNV